MTHLVLKREARVLAAGSVLIIAGIALLLDRLEVLSLRWDKLLWAAGLIFGAILVADGLVWSKRGRTFWGSVLFFTSLYFVLLRFGVIDRYDVPLVPVLFLVFGFSFGVLFLVDTREKGLLIPALLFAGTGTLAILWWWEMVRWMELREVVITYWPVIFVVWGLALLFRRKRTPRHPAF